MAEQMLTEQEQFAWPKRSSAPKSKKMGAGTHEKLHRKMEHC